jgi:hypothetical protein
MDPDPDFGLPFERDQNPVKEGPKKKINTVINSQIYSLYDWGDFSWSLEVLNRDLRIII